MQSRHDEDRRTDTRLDGQYDPATVEPEWQERWVRDDTTDDPETQFTIDTPPPTVSGELHIGHLYQYTLQDFVARFHRMADGDVYFPFGYDDNGIASERLTERELDVRHHEYERPEFQTLTRDVCSEFEAAFTEDVQSLAVSIDWEQTYKTIESRVQRLSQLSFLDLYEQDREYRQNAPTIWCPDCESAISQAETEDTERDTQFIDIQFPLVDGSRENLTVSTTRPELLAACVAVFVHPDDETNTDLIGQTARVPRFEQEIPIMADERVDASTGTGVVMCCTFGDQTDIEWYQAHDLPLRVAIDEAGIMTEQAGAFAGMQTHHARDAIVTALGRAGYIDDRRPITHTVQTHERCGTEIEFLVTDQWYVRLLDRTEEYLALGRELEWYPEKMFARYKHWIEGLQWDWCISRQRDSGIPIPVWYCGGCDEPIFPKKADLPVDPMTDEPPIDGCPGCEHTELEPETDVFDTWATSALTPLLHAGWGYDPDADATTMDTPQRYPIDLRPQGHDIINTWLFHTIVKCYEHTGSVPFEAVMINGMVLDENRNAMSKSKGNVVSPHDVLAEYPVDAARYFAAGNSIGDDFALTEHDLQSGEKLLQKLWNASKLVDELAEKSPTEPEALAAIDRWLLAELDDCIVDVTSQLEQYAFSSARDRLRGFFWHTFCDNYLEIAKHRASPSADFALRTAHIRLLKLFAPFLPHITEELYHRLYATDSIHTQSWPTPAGYVADREAGKTAMEIISALRGYKTERGLALNTDLERVSVYGPIDGFEDAIASVMHVEEFDRLDAPPETETRVVDIDLDYATAGPAYGPKLEKIEKAIETGAFEIRDGTLSVAGERLDSDQFDAHEQRRHDGDGKLLQTEHATMIVE